MVLRTAHGFRQGEEEEEGATGQHGGHSTGHPETVRSFLSHASVENSRLANTRRQKDPPSKLLDWLSTFLPGSLHAPLKKSNQSQKQGPTHLQGPDSLSHLPFKLSICSARWVTVWAASCGPAPCCAMTSSAWLRGAASGAASGRGGLVKPRPRAWMDSFLFF